MRDDDKRQFFEVLALTGSLGLNLAVPIIVGILLGYFIDTWSHLSPWATVGGGLCGLIASLMTLYRKVVRKQ